MVINYNYLLKHNRIELEAFLKTQNLTYDDNIDTVLVIKEKDKIVGCACKKDNVFKMIAVACTHQAQGYVNSLISELINICHQENIFHYFIFTKMQYQLQFENIGFKLLVSYREIGLFEMGNVSFENYYDNIILKKDQGVIVMNCNPFTLGHRYLIEEVLKGVENLVIFVVEENKSFFSFKERLELVQLGIADLNSVQVVAGGPYIISGATFPTYFLKEINDKNEYFTNIDTLLFKKIMEKYHFVKRFVGSEPLDELTSYYNEQLVKNLDDKVEIITRKKVNGVYISASKVREAINEKDFETVKELVVPSTYDYIIKKYGGK